jgi:hypothetical protein
MTRGWNGSAADNSVIEPWEERRARRAAGRKISIAREAAKLRATYRALKLSVPLALVEVDPAAAVVVPTPVYRGRPPSGARTAAMAGGRRTYMGAPCKSGHSGLRYVRQSVCVECTRLRQEARKSTVRPRKAINQTARSRAQRPQMARGRVRGGRGHSRTPKTKRAPRVISRGLCAAKE